MGTFCLSRRAEDDLLHIGAFTLEHWGADQADRYLSELASCFQRIADMPASGRSASQVRSDLRRIEHGRHVVFYRLQPKGILVSRIVHQKMLPEHQPHEDE
jgi:toxin ParE1/3/4